MIIVPVMDITIVLIKITATALPVTLLEFLSETVVVGVSNETPLNSDVVVFLEVSVISDGTLLKSVVIVATSVTTVGCVVFDISSFGIDLSTSWQKRPSQPLVHLQLKLLDRSSHVAPLRHRLSSCIHSSMFNSQ